MSIKRQCFLMGIPYSSYYYRPLKRPDELKQYDELLMQLIDRIYLEEPTFGSRRMVDALDELGYKVHRDHVRRLMREMGVKAIYPQPRLSQPGKGHKIYPYLLRNIPINESDHVWCTDITYIPMGRSHVYLTAVMDWSSRYVISWRLSNSMDTSFCVRCLEDALEAEGHPEIFNTDQGSQFTSEDFTGVLKEHGIKISMDGKGRALDNRMIERLWRSVKYDDIYIKGYESLPELHHGLTQFFEKYNHRKHQGLKGVSPQEQYFRNKSQKQAA